jgi:hypothetical protein
MGLFQRPPNYSRLIFMGTPDFALPSLKALLEAGEEVISVYTQPDRPKGRGKKSTPSPVKERALSYRLPVFQPISLKEGFVQDQLAEQKPDLLIVVAYGLILPKTVLNIPTWGAVMSMLLCSLSIGEQLRSSGPLSPGKRKPESPPCAWMPAWIQEISYFRKRSPL